MADVVCRLPIVESLIAVLYRRIECGEKICCEENIESSNGLYCEWRCWPEQKMNSSCWELGRVKTDFFLGCEAAGVGALLDALVFAVRGAIIQQWLLTMLTCKAKIVEAWKVSRWCRRLRPSGDPWGNPGHFSAKIYLSESGGNQSAISLSKACKVSKKKKRTHQPPSPLILYYGSYTNSISISL